MTTPTSSWHSTSFRLFYCGQAFSYIGDGMRGIAIPLLMFQLTHSAAAVGITYALEFVPLAVIGLIGGSLSDRLDRRSIMLRCDSIRLAAICVLAVGTFRGGIPVYVAYGSIVVLSMAAAVFASSQSPSLLFLLGKERVFEANAALVATEQATSVATPPLGGALYALAGPLPALMLNATTYLLSLACLAGVKTFGPEVRMRTLTLSGVRGDVESGFRQLFADSALWSFTVLDSILNFFLMLTGATLIPYLSRAYGANDATIRITFGIGAFGALVGSAIAAKFPKSIPIGRVLAVSYPLNKVALLPLVFAANIYVVIAAIAIWNAVSAFESVQLSGWRLRVVPAEIVGRVFGAIRLMSIAGVVPAAVVGGLLADRFSVRAPVIVSTVCGLAIASLVTMLPVTRSESR